MTYEQNYLEHHGILGQKWGVRRYQNEDGTLTEEGKKRYGSDSEPESKTWKKKDAEKLSDEELRRRNNRLQAERQYRDLTTTQAERERAQLKSEIKKDFIKKALIVPVGAIILYAGNKLIKNNGTKVVDTIAKYGSKVVSKIKENRNNKIHLKNMISRGSQKYQRKFSENLREYFPRENGGYGGRDYNLVNRNPPLWKPKARTGWPAL